MATVLPQRQLLLVPYLHLTYFPKITVLLKKINSIVNHGFKAFWSSNTELEKVLSEIDVFAKTLKTWLWICSWLKQVWGIYARIVLFLAMVPPVDCWPRAGVPPVDPCSSWNGAAWCQGDHIGRICFFLTLERTPSRIVCEINGARKMNWRHEIKE